jgi:hypothetical protein
MKQIAPTITEHRKTRLVAWARLLPFWVGALMFRDSLGRISERHLLARGFYANLDAVARTINNIIVLHASAKLVCVPSLAPVAAPISASACNIAICSRFLLIVNALNTVDALSDRAARRLARGLTRLFCIRLIRPPHEPARTLATPPVLAADSS